MSIRERRDEYMKVKLFICFILRNYCEVVQDSNCLEIGSEKFIGYFQLKGEGSKKREECG